MVADSRVFINVNKAMAAALASIPAEIIEGILCQNGIDKTAVKILFNVAGSFGKNSATIPDGLACLYAGVALYQGPETYSVPSERYHARQGVSQ